MRESPWRRGGEAGRTAAAVPVVAVVVALATLVLAAGIGGATVQPLVERQADLAVEEPSYVEQGVETQSANGSVVYIAQGSPIDVRPLNFDPRSVQDFGLVGSTGDLSYDADMGQYRLRTDTPGTYSLYWIVTERVAVDGDAGAGSDAGSGSGTSSGEAGGGGGGAGGDAANGTAAGTDAAANGTPTPTATPASETTLRQVRYVARVRVTGGLAIRHVSDEEFAATRAAAANWSEWRAEICALAGDDPETCDVETRIQESLNIYQWKVAPVGALTGDLTTIIQVLFITLGGLTLVGLALLGHQLALWSLAKRLFRHEVVESEEGAAAEKLAALDEHQRLSKSTLVTPQDWFESDTVAERWRETFGGDLKESLHTFYAAIDPVSIVADRLLVRAEQGYRVVVDERAADVRGGGAGDGNGPAPGDAVPDGGAAAPPGGSDVPTGPTPAHAVVDAHLAHADDLPVDAPAPDPDDPFGADVIDPRDLDVEQLDRLVAGEALRPWDEGALASFAMVDADVDFDAMDAPLRTLSLDEVTDRLQTGREAFTDERVFGAFIHDFLATVERHPMTDGDGTVKPLRSVLSDFLKVIVLCDDRFSLPVSFAREAVEAALDAESASDDAEAVLEEVRDGHTSEDDDMAGDGPAPGEADEPRFDPMAAFETVGERDGAGGAGAWSIDGGDGARGARGEGDVDGGGRDDPEPDPDPEREDTRGDPDGNGPGGTDGGAGR